MEEEAITAELQDHGFLLQMDGNLHGGPSLVNDDPNVQNTNGKFFEHFLERNPFLTVANNLNICQGKITRIRKLQDKTEIAILDFLIMNDKLRPFLSKFVIDEERNFCLSNFSQYKKNKRVIETDHNLMLADFNVSIPKRKPDRIELFNLRDKKCQEIFSQETEINPELFQCFDSHLPFEVQCKIWLKNFNSILYKCFKKVRITNNKKKKGKYDDLLHERIELKKEAKLISIDEDMKRRIEARIFQIENQVSDEISEKYVEEIVEVLKKLGGDGQNLSGSGRKEIWNILKKKYPKCETAVPIGKKDKSGNIVSNHEGLKDIYLIYFGDF